MIKNRSIRVVLACAVAAAGASSAFAGLPTMDPGNIAGTIGIVTQGATGIQQGIETIANGSNLNSIIGDAAGTLAKFNEKYGDDIEKGRKAAEDTQKRLTEGVETYNKYQGEIAARKAEYDALMETVSSYTGSASYEDGDEGEYDYDTEYSADYDEGYDADYDAAAVSTLETVDGALSLNSNVVGTELNTVRGETTLASGQTAVSAQPAVMSEIAVRPAVVAGKMQAAEFETQTLSVEAAVADGLTTEETLAAPAVLDKRASLAKAGKVETVSSITNETTGRRRFGSAGASALTKIDAVNKVDAAAVKNNTLPVGATTAATGSISTETLNKVQSATAVNSARSATSAPALNAGAASARKFRVSPSLTAPAQELGTSATMKIEKMSNSTVSYSSRMTFADESEDDTKGVGYDSKGTFISPLAQRCGVSIKDLQDGEKLKACTNKIVSENFAKNQYDAINSRKDCERMIYTTVVALLAETTQSKYEASNYDETLDKQEEAGSGATDTRDDSALIALSNEQTQILLNRMSLLVSTQIILDSIQQLCTAPKDVLKEINTDDDKTEATDGGK